MFKILLNYYIKDPIVGGRFGRASIFRGGYYANIPTPLDITDRISINQLDKFRERIEATRFGWETADVKVEINNYDDLIEAGSFKINTIEFQDAYDYFTGINAVYGVAFNNVFGWLVYIYYNDIELFRGCITDIGMLEFDNIHPKRVTFTAYSFHELIRRQKIDFDLRGNVSDGSYSAPLSTDRLESDLKTLLINNLGYVDWDGHFQLSAEFDLSGILDFDYSIKFSETEFYDMWQNPIDQRVFCITKEADDIIISEVRANKLEKMFSLPVSGGEHFIRFVRANLCSETIAFTRRVNAVENFQTWIYSYDGTRYEYYSRREGVRVGTSDVHFQNLVYHNYVKYTPVVINPITGETAILPRLGWLDVDRFLYKIESDGQYLYRCYNDGYAVNVDRYNSNAVLLGSEVVNAVNWTHVFVTGLNVLSYRRNHRGSIRYFSQEYGSGIEYEGVVSIIETINIDFPLGSTFRVYPTYYNDDDISVKGEFYIEEALRKANFYTNDALFIALSSMVYDKPTFEDIFSDIAQFFNAILFIRGKTIYITQFDRYRDSYTISENWFSLEDYKTKAKDDRNTVPKIKINGQGASGGDGDYDLDSIEGNLRAFYRDELQGLFLEVQCIIPTILSLNYKLGDELILNGRSYMLIERELGFSPSGKMTKLTLRGSL